MNSPTVYEVLYDSMRAQYAHLAPALNSLVAGLELSYPEAELIVNLVVLLWEPNAKDEEVATAAWLHWLNALAKGRQRPMAPRIRFDHHEPQVAAFWHLTFSIAKRYRELHNAMEGESARACNPAIAER